MTQKSGAVLVTGGAGYIGSVLTPRLLAAGYRVAVFDRFFFGRDTIRPHPALELIDADIRDGKAVGAALDRGKFDAVIHLAAVSNDPSSEIDPELTRQINRVALEDVMRRAKSAGVRRFLYASSASVYGVKGDPDVHEDLPLEPITLYAKYKAEGEEVLSGLTGPDFVGVSVRAATVCGASPRLRLDLTINILSYQAFANRKITVFGGDQMRPNIVIDDLVDFYLLLLTAPAERVRGRALNVCHSNATVRALAELVRARIDPATVIEVSKTNDHRSYHLSGARAREVLGFAPKHSLESAVDGLLAAFRDGGGRDLTARIYRNVEQMKADRASWELARR
jgi:nucleoside-diphosphate-sugar epimerase